MFNRLIETSVELHNLIDTTAHFTFSSLVLADPLKIIRLLGLIGASSSGVRGVWRNLRVAQLLRGKSHRRTATSTTNYSPLTQVR